MKILAILVGITITVLLLLYILLKGNLTFFSNIKHEIQANNNMPSFIFFETDNSKFSFNELEINKPTIIIHFNTTCEHCQAFANQLYSYSKRLDQTQILFVSEEDYHQIREFRLKYHLDSLPFVKFLKSKNDNCYNLFKSRSIPSFLFYNKNKKLIKKIEGEVKVESFVKYANK